MVNSGGLIFSQFFFKHKIMYVMGIVWKIVFGKKLFYTTTPTTTIIKLVRRLQLLPGDNVLVPIGGWMLSPYL
jgi:hypothetical protein